MIDFSLIMCTFLNDFSEFYPPYDIDKQKRMGAAFYTKLIKLINEIWYINGRHCKSRRIQ